VIAIIATRDAEPSTGDFFGIPSVIFNGNDGVVQTFHRAWEASRLNHPAINLAAIVLAYVHNDVTIHEDGWAARVQAEFDADPKVAIVGMGGATGIGTPEIYKRPYNIWQLQRIGYASNQTDWQVHGEHETGSRDVAVVDGFFMAIRRSFLDEIGGWDWMKCSFHCYDTAMCLMAHRKGWKVRMVGVNCTHHGGGTSTGASYKTWLEANGRTLEQDHSEPHDWLYREFSDLLPLRVK